jgi:nucleoid-associated protein YgaU
MKYTATVSIALLAAAITGCSNNNKKPTAVSPGATDLRSSSVAAAPAPQPTPAPQPVVIQPAQPVQPVVSDTPTPVATTATPAITGSTYTVQKGDTLSKIARAKYGNTSAIRKIKEANPGIDANNIKPGQKLNLPS